MLWLLPLAAALLAPVLAWCLWSMGTVTPAMAAHGAMMLTAWGLLIPAGGVVARYFEVMPGQDFPRVHNVLTWWDWHRGLQYGGTALATAALGVILSETGGRADTWHGRFGLVVMASAWLQILSGWLRGSRGGPTDTTLQDPARWRGDHYDMTPRRIAFERWHKTVGWATLLLAAVTMLLGAGLVGAPGWLVAVIGGLQAAAVLALIDGVLRGRWVDTYAALWGTETRHPGNRRGNKPSS